MYLTAKLYGIRKYLRFISPAAIFMMSTMVVNGGNYAYNIGLGRILSPAAFSQAGLLVTLLLVFSFIATTFQIVATKFAVEFDGVKKSLFIKWLSTWSLIFGLILGGLLFFGSHYLAYFFQLPTSNSLRIFSCSIPFFFTMSVQRGVLQGEQKFIQLSGSYQIEMWVRLFVTFSLMLIVGVSSGTSISLSVVASIFAAFLVVKKGNRSIALSNLKGFYHTGEIIKFFFLTALYEGTQIMINYSDILLVKHYFDSDMAGHYTSMALIGRMIYFITWMMVMVLIPKVLYLKKKELPFEGTLLKYFAVIAGISGVLIICCLVFGRQIVFALFGTAYSPVSHLLWMYALATMLFALANLLVYYFLALDKRIPIYIATLFGFIQLIQLNVFHSSLEQVIWVQVVNMSLLLFVQVLYFLVSRRPSSKA